MSFVYTRAGSRTAVFHKVAAAKLARFSWLPGGLAAALVIGAGRLLSSTSSAPLELAVYDRVVRAADTVPSRDVVIVSIDDASIAKLGEWPWPREVRASLIDRLRADGSRVVAFTVPFDPTAPTSEQERARAALAILESSNLGGSAQAEQLRRRLGESATGQDPDSHLAQAIALHGNVILPLELRNGESESQLPARFTVAGGSPAVAPRMGIAQAPPEVLIDAVSALGHTWLRADADGTVRTDATTISVGTSSLPSFATAVAARARGVDISSLHYEASSSLVIGDSRIPVDASLHIRPQYFPATGPRSFEQYPYWQVLAGEVPRASLRDKVVLVGFVSGPSAGAIATPLAGATPLVVTQASTVSSLIDETVYSRPPLAIVCEWLAAILVVVFAAFILPAVGMGIGSLATVLIVAILVIGEVGLLTSMQWWARLMLPCVGALAGLGLYTLGELLRRANVDNEQPASSASQLRSLGQTFQRQGQLDLAFETYRRCPLDAPTMELLYFLGMDFERRLQLPRAAEVYGYIATRDPNYRDLRNRRARVKEPAQVQRTDSARPLARPVPDAPQVESMEPSTSAPSRTLGRYQIERELGKGAMGIVYLGRDPKINRVVAIKAIPLAQEFEEDDLDEARARFFREAEMAGRLNHPAIVTVYDAGEDQGLAYIAMEYLRGIHLSHFADPTRLLPVKSVMLLVARVADALHYAHRQNVVHRDIKPANIMFNSDTDELKITDFGIARLTDTSRTKTGIVLGTPSFMSPEQLEGRTLDGRSDQFALGVSLYQLLCGQLPFRAESMPRLMHKIATEPHAQIRLVRPDLPESIGPIVDRVLAKSADDRYVTCAELAAALRTCAGSDSATAPAQPKHEWLIP
jgi:serine/threonine-protein kinase